MDTFLEYVQKHYAWIAAIIAGIVLLAVNLWITKRRAQKALSYWTVTDTPLVRTRQGAKGKIEILYEGKPVDSVRLVEIELRNTGGKEIEAKDFAEPVRITFPDGLDLYELE